MLQACRDLGAAFVAFSPVGRGFLAGGVRDNAQLASDDFRIGMPRFQGEAFAANLKLLSAFSELATSASCTPAQLCLAWLLQKDPIIVPIPGTSDPDHVFENAKAADLRLDAAIFARVDELVNAKTVSGPRYAPEMQASIDTED